MSTDLPAEYATDLWSWFRTGTPLERATRILAVLTGFSIPLSTSFSEICTTLFIGCWLCSGNWRSKWTDIRSHVVALGALCLFGMLGLAMTWSTAGWFAAARCLLKYREFLYIPMFLVVFRDAPLRRVAVSAFLLGGVALLGLSYSEWLIGTDIGMESASQDFVIGKDHIIHSLIMALVVYLLAGRTHAALETTWTSGQRNWKWVAIYGVLLSLAIYNELCMLTGRTGYVVLGALFCLFCAERMGRRGLVIASLLVAVSGWAGITFSSSIRSRVDQTISQLRNQLGPERKHSPDPRMEFYANSLQMISRHPWLGTGTGSFEREYAKQIAGTDDARTTDPHNEYLHLACQAGIPTALAFLSLLGLQWFLTGRLPVAERSLGRGVLAAIALGSLFNSLILSVTGGLIYSYFSAIAFAALDTSSAAAPSQAPPSAEHSSGTRRAA
ncbi:MAG: O-antigen ligase family protein [Planctomycetes bacterium]|nr:O-antigen ligase family protein [Planctomycetota bacterium]